jgi:hypothetical protein
LYIIHYTLLNTVYNYQTKNKLDVWTCKYPFIISGFRDVSEENMDQPVQGLEYELGKQGIVDRFLVEGILITRASSSALGPTLPPIQWVAGYPSLEVVYIQSVPRLFPRKVQQTGLKMNTPLAGAQGKNNNATFFNLQ